MHINKFILTIFILSITCNIQAQYFTDVSIQSGIDYLPTRAHKGVSWGGITVLDFNNDGLEDIFMPGGIRSDALYKNNGDGTFTDVIEMSGIKSITDSHVTLGAIAGDIDNDGFREIFITTAFPDDTTLVFSPNLLLKNNGDGTFDNITMISGIGIDSMFSGASSFGDINNDGYLDIFVSNLVSDRYTYAGQLWGDNDPDWSISPDDLFLNNGDGTFTEISDEIGIIDPGAGLGCAFFDYNNDANIDLYSANDDLGTPTEANANSLFHNQFPNENFLNLSKSSNSDQLNTSMGVAVGDYDENGYLDLYVTYCGDNTLLANSGDGTFEDKTYYAGVEDGNVPVVDSINPFTNIDYTYTPEVNFVGRDTSQLYYCITETDTCIEFNLILRVIDKTQEPDWYPWHRMKAIGQDLFLEVEKNKLVNICFTVDDGDYYVFSVTPFEHGIEKVIVSPDELPTTGWGANFLDFDNDGKLDLFVSNGSETPDGAIYDNPNTFFKNTGNGRFENVSILSGVDNPWPSRGSVTLDYDNDGDEDLFVMNLPYLDGMGTSHDPHSILFRNNLELNSFNNWLKVKLEGTVSNRDGIGSMLRAYIGVRTILRQVDGGSSAMSHNSINIHFGLGPYLKVDSLEIVWPGGCTQILYDIDVNQQLNITQSCETVTGINNNSDQILKTKVYPNPVYNKASFIINFNSNDVANLLITDISGKQIVFEKKIKLNEYGTNLFSIDVSMLKSGVYIYHLDFGSFVESDKLVIID